jgi:hypothetical protein
MGLLADRRECDWQELCGELEELFRVEQLVGCSVWVSLAPDCQMTGARLYVVYTKLSELGNVVDQSPALEILWKGENVGCFEGRFEVVTAAGWREVLDSLHGLPEVNVVGLASTGRWYFDFRQTVFLSPRVLDQLADVVDKVERILLARNSAAHRFMEKALVNLWRDEFSRNPVVLDERVFEF